MTNDLKTISKFAALAMLTATAPAMAHPGTWEQHQSASQNGNASEMQGAQPRTYRDVDFPFGDLSFADQVVLLDHGQTAPSDKYRNAQASLGAPDWKGGSKCKTKSGCTFTSLGRGGALVVEFTDNFLIGSGDSGIDLWIFEVGPQVEDMSVEISGDGIDWQSVGSIGGGRSGVDIDAFGFGPGDAFSFVRLTDDPQKDGKSGATVGADVDAVGAVSSRPRQASECTCP